MMQSLFAYVRNTFTRITKPLVGVMQRVQFEGYKFAGDSVAWAKYS